MSGPKVSADEPEPCLNCGTQRVAEPREEQPTSDPLLVDIRAALQTRPRWTNDYAATKFGALLNRAHDRIEQLQMPHAEVLRLAEVSDDGADAQALIKALCAKVEAQRRRLAQMERDHREDMCWAVAEERRAITTGEPYGTY